MSWAIAVGAVISVASGVLGSKSRKKAEEKARKQRLNMIDADYTNSIKQMNLESSLQDYYQQQQARDRYIGGLNYAGYNTVNDFQPDYVSTSTAPVLPTINSG